MGAPFLAEVDWRRPWLASVRAAAETIIHAGNWREAVNEEARNVGLQNHRGLPVSFVPQASLPAGVAYEAFIGATGGVPTRDNLHDFFNALVWLTFPKIKIQLNALHAREIAAAEAQEEGNSRARGRGNVRDAATLFDENAALLVVREDSLLDALRGHRWGEAFVDRRDAFGRDCEIWLFGHALMEKLVCPYKAITAHAWPLFAAPGYFGWADEEKRSWLDSAVAEQVAGGLTTSSFTPLPILGVPGWWEGQDHVFYEDQTVFRPKRADRMNKPSK